MRGDLELGLGKGAWRAVPFDEVDRETFEGWERLRLTAPAFRSPFFHPRFAAAVHETGRPVTVVVRRNAHGVDAIWPLEVRRTRALPVGWPAADFQGPIALAEVDPAEVLTVLGRRTLSFDHLTEGVLASSAVRVWRPSPYLDVAGGMDGYRARISKSARDRWRRAQNRGRRAAVEFGDLRFTPSSTSAELLEQVVTLKRRQYATTGVGDFFADPRHRRLLADLLQVGSEDFTGVLSAVHCGDTLLAAHFGLRSSGVLHWWFPVYNPALARFGPGWILMRELIASSTDLGYDRIDLGRGDDEFKRRIMTGAQRVGTGLVTRSAAERVVLTLDTAVHDLVRGMGVAPKMRRSMRAARRALRATNRG